MTGSAGGGAPRASLEVLATGPAATVQDLGRPGLARLGVGPSGAADRTSLRQANRLLGNPPGAAAIEVTLGGLQVRATAGMDVAVVGTDLPMSVSGGSGAGRTRVAVPGGPVRLAAGDVLTLGLATRGLRAYLAVRGGVDVPPVLGSRSTDRLADLGPLVLQPGAVLPVGVPSGGWPGVDQVPWLTDPARPVTLDAVVGPRQDWLDAGSLARLGAPGWTVAADADRTAVVLDGPLLRRARPGEVPTEGMVRGAVQVPPSGRPAVLMADHPVTGGYPVVAVLVDAAVDRLAQLRPGAPVRFRLLPEVWW